MLPIPECKGKRFIYLHFSSIEYIRLSTKGIVYKGYILYFGSIKEMVYKGRCIRIVCATTAQLMKNDNNLEETEGRKG